MTYRAQVVRVLLASPLDVSTERDAIGRRYTVGTPSIRRTLRLCSSLSAGKAASAESGDRPQAVVNPQIVDRSDILIGVFWTRLGTATGTAESGSVEEVSRFMQAGKPVALYFSNRPAAPDSIDPAQLSAVRQFQKHEESHGLVGSFGDVTELIRQVAHALTRFVRERFGVSDASLAVREAPNAHVSARVAPGGPSQYFIALTNVGGGEAQAVTMKTETGDGGEGWMVMQGNEPLDFLATGQTVEYRAVIHLGSPPRVNGFFQWRNEDGSEGTSRQSLQL